MKKLFSIIALCLVGTATNAQAPYAQFQEIGRAHV